MAGRIQLRRGTAANWTSANPTLAAGEVGVETDTGYAKVGDGTLAWTSLDYVDQRAVALLGDHLVDTVGAHAASAISYAGSTNLAATTVEAALDELDSEKAPVRGITPESYGAKGDGQLVADAAMTASSAVLTSASGLFTSQDVGKTINVRGAGALLSAPSAPTITQASTGGTIAAGTNVSYKVAARTAAGTTLCSSAGTATISAGTNTNTATITWTAVSGATSYEIYGRTSGSELLMERVPAGTLSWTDKGSVTPSGAQPGANTAAQILTSTIASHQSATQVTLANAATTTTSSAHCDWGTDDYAAFAAAIAALPAGGRLLLDAKRYHLSSSLTITKSMTIEGVGSMVTYKPLSTALCFDSPSQAPYLLGSVLVGTSSAQDVLKLTGSGMTVHLYGFGITWAEPYRYVNTGHGVYAHPTASYSSGSDHGTMYSTWRNVQVFGVDGEHYAFTMNNPLYNRWENLKSWGGGGFRLLTDSYASNYGNHVADGCYAHLTQRGSAHGWFLQGRTNGANQGYLNLFVLIRPQCNISANEFFQPETSGPDLLSQYAFDAGTNVGNLSLIQPDFEPTADSVLVRFNTGQYFITTDGIYGSLQSSDFAVARGVQGSKLQYSKGYSSGRVAAATVAAGANAGSSPPAPVASNCGDFGGQITFGTGTSAAAGAQVQVTFSQFRGTAYSINVTPTNAATAALGTWYAVKGGSSFTICCTGTPSSSQADTTYAVDYSLRFDS